MIFSLLQSLGDIPLAFVDVETTGASPDFSDRVTEIGIVRIEGGVVASTFSALVDPQRRIGAGVVALTGITNDMVAGLPPFAERLPEIAPMLGGAVVVGHNVRFDLSFISMELRRARTSLREVCGDVPVLDTVRIARRRFGRGGNGLQRLAARLGIVPSVAHRALADADTTHRVFDRMMEPVGGWGTCLCDAIREQGGPMGLEPASPRESALPLELQEALEQRGRVTMEYLDARQRSTHRVIEPLEVRKYHGELLLVAHCRLRNDRRTFKVDRIVRLERLEAGTEISATDEC